MNKYRADSANDISYNSYQSRVDSAAAEEEWFDDFFQAKREECYEFVMGSGYGKGPSWKYKCSCWKTLEPTETIYVNEDMEVFCEDCFEKQHQTEAEDCYNSNGDEY